MSLLALLPLLASTAPEPSFELYDYDPVAATDATVSIPPFSVPHSSENASVRFTVLTPHLIRMEYTTHKKFEDRATLAFINRNLPVPQFTKTQKGGVLTISTSAIELNYKIGTAFTKETLQVKPTNPNSADNKFTGWHPGARNDANLLGTIKSLDELGVETLNCTENANVSVHEESLHCEWGLISRDGWSLIDDTSNWGLTSGAEWWDSPNTDAIDWYLFAHGHNYKQAILDYTLVGGKVPIVPRYALGVWFTRWYDFNNYGVKRLVNKYRQKSLPLDVYVTDMNWHKKDNWGGWTFDLNLYPDGGDSTFGWLHQQGLATSANLHDANGVGDYDKMFPEMCKAMGLDPDKTKTVPFSIVNKTYVYALEDIVLGDVADKIDFMWIDWQQGGKQGGAAGGKQNPTIWTNKIRVTDPKRQGKKNRGLVLARWGGLGTHRYQVGFSGDVRGLTWANLAYQPYFSLTSANVAYGFWSHDIEGPGSDPEMYTRWIQWAAYSGVLRSHDRGMSGGGCAGDVPDVRSDSCSNVRPWEVPEKYFDSIRDALVARAEMVPFLYTAAHSAFETGLGLLMPMYYEHPEEDNAYLASPNGSFAQYYFGSNDMIVSPITSPLDNVTNLASRAVWLPPGDMWFERDTGVMRKGGQVLTKEYDLSEVPVFIKAGAVLPSTILEIGNTLGRARKQYELLAFTVYPGANSGSGYCYEDDAETHAYLSGNYAMTKLVYSRKKSTTSSQSAKMQFEITTNGTYPELATVTRRYQVNIVNSMPPRKVYIDGEKVAFRDLSEGGSDNSQDAAWWFDGPEMTLRIRTGSNHVQPGTVLRISVEMAYEVDPLILSGLKGIFRHANLAKDNLDETRSEPGAHDTHGGALSQLSSVGDMLSYWAYSNTTAFTNAVHNYRHGLQAAISELASVKGNRVKYSQALLNNIFN